MNRGCCRITPRLSPSRPSTNTLNWRSFSAPPRSSPRRPSSTVRAKIPRNWSPCRKGVEMATFQVPDAVLWKTADRCVALEMASIGGTLVGPAAVKVSPIREVAADGRRFRRNVEGRGQVNSLRVHDEPTGDLRPVRLSQQLLDLLLERLAVGMLLQLPLECRGEVRFQVVASQLFRIGASSASCPNWMSLRQQLRPVRSFLHRHGNSPRCAAPLLPRRNRPRNRCFLGRGSSRRSELSTVCR